MVGTESLYLSVGLADLCVISCLYLSAEDPNSSFHSGKYLPNLPIFRFSFPLFSNAPKSFKHLLRARIKAMHHYELLSFLFFKKKNIALLLFFQYFVCFFKINSYFMYMSALALCLTEEGIRYMVVIHHYGCRELNSGPLQ